MIAAIRKKFPDATIHLAIARSCQTLAPAIPGVDRFLIAKNSMRDASHWFALMAGRYDYCLDLTRTDRSATLTFLSRARKKITYERTTVKSKWRPFLYDEFV